MAQLSGLATPKANSLAIVWGVGMLQALGSNMHTATRACILQHFAIALRQRWGIDGPLDCVHVCAQQLLYVCLVLGGTA